MRAYIVAFISSFDSELKQYYILDKSRVDALVKFLAARGIDVPENRYSVEQIKEMMYDMDCNISAFQL